MITHIYPYITVNGEKFYKLGCKDCDACDWEVASDGEKFIARCHGCKKIVELRKDNLLNDEKDEDRIKINPALDEARRRKQNEDLR